MRAASSSFQTAFAVGDQVEEPDYDAEEVPPQPVVLVSRQKPRQPLAWADGEGVRTEVRWLAVPKTKDVLDLPKLSEADAKGYLRISKHLTWALRHGNLQAETDEGTPVEDIMNELVSRKEECFQKI